MEECVFLAGSEQMIGQEGFHYASRYRGLNVKIIIITACIVQL